jgi:hypothetical protein
MISYGMVAGAFILFFKELAACLDVEEAQHGSIHRRLPVR